METTDDELRPVRVAAEAFGLSVQDLLQRKHGELRQEMLELKDTHSKETRELRAEMQDLKRRSYDRDERTARGD